MTQQSVLELCGVSLLDKGRCEVFTRLYITPIGNFCKMMKKEQKVMFDPASFQETALYNMLLIESLMVLTHDKRMPPW